MRVVNPEAQLGHSRTRTLTERIKELGFGSAALIDAGFVLLLGLAALVGLITTFDTPHFLLVGTVGLVLGILFAHVVVQLRWHGAWLAVIVVGLIALIGPGIAARDDAFAGFLPSPASLAVVYDTLVNGWKQLLTTLPPVPGDGNYLALPFAITLVAGALGFFVARRSRRPAAALVTPTLLLVLITLLGTRQTLLPVVQGLVLAALGFAWLAVRHRRRRHLTTTGRSRGAGLLTGAGLLAGALALGGLLGGALPGADTPRWVLRDYVQPPVEVKDLSSPLVGFRRYSSPALQQLWDAELFTVTGAAPKSLLRLAVLDDYTGHTWSASGAGGGFQRIGSRLPDVAGTPVSVVVTFSAAYANTREVGPWLPSLGSDTSIAFSGANVKVHNSALRYNVSTGQGLLTGGDRFHEGDILTISSVPVPVGFDAGAVPVGQGIDPAAYAFLANTAQKWAGGAATPGEQVLQLAQHLKGGYWSDGTGNGQADYLPGHSQGRLTNFVLGDQLVGSDEQYASTFALLCNQAGFPARVVFGAIVPDNGVVKGQNITAWVEVETDQGWKAISPDVFTPDRNRVPDQVPQTRSQDKNATNVPPPNTARTDSNPTDVAEADLSGTKVTRPWWDGLLKAFLAVLRVVGPPLLMIVGLLTAIVVTKVVRRRRRRTVGTVSTRVAGAWREVFDQCRDLGILVPRAGTRLEQAAAIGRREVTAFAVSANTATFGPDDPTAEDAAALWTAATLTRKQLLGSVGRWRRFVARINLRSLLPERLAVAQVPQLDLRRPHWMDSAGRRAAPPVEAGQG
ncbi:MAG: hypothetical protein CVT62_09420 [Actinobacteria bacterium HGW-Actinobacteria-2]|nr:MAG: hypothetical protein CVT62_09420 [Actinobacteria bacterium HGW-Actinobacteria-2]